VGIQSTPLLAQNDPKTETYKPPRRGAPDGRASGATRDMERRVALVIGNGSYEYLPRLDNPASDAQLMAKTLQSVGFQVIGGEAQTNLDRAGIERAIREFGAALRGGGVGLFYYAGHGLQLRGNNYLVPVGANPETTADVDFELVNANIVIDQMEAAGSNLNIVILDACRNNPFGGRGLRAAAGGLAEMQAPRGTLISYATQPGNVAMDGTSGHSPYTTALAEVIRRPGLPILEVFNEIGVAVDRATGGRQEPWVSHSPLEGIFYFLGPTTVNIIPSAPSASSSDGEIVFWQSIENSKASADFEEYLRKYPNGQFAGLSRNRLAALQVSPSTLAAQSPTVSPSNKAMAASTDDERRQVQRALKALGHFQGEADGGFGAGTRTAIKEFQLFLNDPETGTLIEAERKTLLDMAERLAVLFDQPAKSPRGVAAASIKGTAERYSRAYNLEIGKGVKSDPADAAYWYTLAAADGDSKALTNLGRLLARGWSDTPPDPTDAALLWWVAAAHGEASAMFNEGVVYERGLGITADLPRARAWYERAAALNDDRARDAIKRLGL
jgi:hypothetical protein